MKILGIDTSTKFLVIGIYDNGKVYEYTLEAARKLSSIIAVAIKGVMEAAGLTAGEIDYFACGLGPGSFTGMRIGLAAVKGLSWALDKPVIGIPSLDILAKNAQEAGKGKDVIALVDAKRKLFYCGFYRIQGDRLKRKGPYALLSEKEFLRRVKAGSIILGDGIDLLGEGILKQARGITVLERDYWYPKPRNIIELTLESLKQKKIASPDSLRPVYLYPKDCQVKRA